MTIRQHGPTDDQPPDASNDVYLSGRLWLLVGAVVMAVLIALPVVWHRVERFEPADDFRIPYTLSDDYWLFGRWCGDIQARRQTFVLGDSVVWGHYVSQGRTLSAELNRLARGQRFANAGVDGIHPAAMAGLVSHHADGMRDANVVLHCNLLWMSSRRHDLRETKEFTFNHPRLVPQFFPSIACYRESAAGRMRNVVHRYVPAFQWAEHLQMLYFDRSDVPAWTIEHPREDPLRRITLQVPSGRVAASEAGESVPWTAKNIPPMDAAWVPLRESFQWEMFRRTVDALLSRDNRVFVVVGPFNEPMLTEDSRRRFRDAKNAAATWLGRRGVPHFLCPPLPSDLYADASHPLADGYAEMARRLWENADFAAFDGRKGATR